MANELRYFSLSGLTITCEVRLPDGTLVGSAASLSEDGSSGRYYGDFPSAAAGTYDLFFLESGVTKVAGTVEWSGALILGHTQGVTATGFSTFDPVTDEVTTDSASRTASRADISGLPTTTDIVAALTAANVDVSLVSPLLESGYLKLPSHSTIEITIPATIPGARSDVIFTIKSSLSDADDEALVKATETGGLTVLNGAVAAEAGWASVTVTGSNDSVGILLTDDLMAVLPAGGRLYYDLKWIDLASASGFSARGSASVSQSVTRQI